MDSSGSLISYGNRTISFGIPEFSIGPERQGHIYIYPVKMDIYFVQFVNAV
jgi:hypothetical protein